jgi:hypothetical protein
MLLNGCDFICPQQSFDFDHNRPDYVDIDGIGGYAALEGFFYNGAAGLSVATQQRFQVSFENVLLYHNLVSIIVFFIQTAYFIKNSDLMAR